MYFSYYEQRLERCAAILGPRKCRGQLRPLMGNLHIAYGRND